MAEAARFAAVMIAAEKVRADAEAAAAEAEAAALELNRVAAEAEVAEASRIAAEKARCVAVEAARKHEEERKFQEAERLREVALAKQREVVKLARFKAEEEARLEIEHRIAEAQEKMRKAKEANTAALERIAETKERHARDCVAVATRREALESALEEERRLTDERAVQAIDMQKRITMLQEAAARLHISSTIAHKRRVEKEKIAADASRKAESLQRRQEAARETANAEKAHAAEMLAEYNKARFWYLAYV
jgi:fused signal recognition particle receptor